MRPILHVAVLVPARDEQTLIASCLRSVAAARERLPPGISSEVVVVSDRSVDRTAAIAREFLGHSGLVVATNAGSVGNARAIAARYALSRYRGPRERCWLANTDADCEVPDTWLIDQLASAELGAVAVAGVIDVEDFAEHDANVRRRFRETYSIAPDGTHSHVHGANIGIRADAYTAAGGWSDLELAEEHDLWSRIQGARISDGHLRVVTSGRRMSRVVGGFADALAAHNDSEA